MEVVESWVDDGGPQVSAAIAYYSILSLAPVLILVSALVGLVVEEVPTEGFELQLALILGRRGAEFAMGFVEEPLQHTSVSGLVGNVAILLVGATVVFANVQGALNRIWGLRWVAGGLVRGVLRQRVLAFTMIVVTGLVMLVSAGLGAIARLVAEPLLDTVPAVVTLIDAGVSVVVLALLFGASFRILPDGDVAWRDVALGASVTAAFFVVGKLVITAYLARASVVSAYGVAGSLVFFLVWVYYSAAIFFLGAEFTQQWGIRRGRPIQPDRGVVRVTSTVEDPHAEA